MPKKPKIRYSEETAALVEEYAACGMTQAQVGVVLKMSPDSIQRYYAEAWAHGKAQANAKIGRKLYDLAMAGNVAALIFWAKTQMGWRETQQIDHTSSDGTMSPGNITIDIDKMTPDDLARKVRAVFRGDASLFDGEK